MRMRVPYAVLFEVDGDLISARLPVQLGNVQLSSGIWFTTEQQIGGFVLHSFVGHDLEVDEDQGVYVIRGVHDTARPRFG
jgi:hypothetical protein